MQRITRTGTWGSYSGKGENSSSPGGDQVWGNANEMQMQMQMLMLMLMQMHKGWLLEVFIHQVTGTHDAGFDAGSTPQAF